MNWTKLWPSCSTPLNSITPIGCSSSNSRRPSTTPVATPTPSAISANCSPMAASNRDWLAACAMSQAEGKAHDQVSEALHDVVGRGDLGIDLKHPAQPRPKISVDDHAQRIVDDGVVVATQAVLDRQVA